MKLTIVRRTLDEELAAAQAEAHHHEQEKAAKSHEGHALEARKKQAEVRRSRSLADTPSETGTLTPLGPPRPQDDFKRAQRRTHQLNRTISDCTAKLEEEQPNNIAALQENKRVRPLLPRREPSFLALAASLIPRHRPQETEDELASAISQFTAGAEANEREGVDSEASAAVEAKVKLEAKIKKNENLISQTAVRSLPPSLSAPCDRDADADSSSTLVVAACRKRSTSRSPTSRTARSRSTRCKRRWRATTSRSSTTRRRSSRPRSCARCVFVVPSPSPSLTSVPFALSLTPVSLPCSSQTRIEQASAVCERPTNGRQQDSKKLQKEIETVERALKEREKRQGASIEQILEELEIRRKVASEAVRQVNELAHLVGVRPVPLLVRLALSARSR